LGAFTTVGCAAPPPTSEGKGIPGTDSNLGFPGISNQGGEDEEGGDDDGGD
jgi:hypothetical protein